LTQLYPAVDRREKAAVSLVVNIRMVGEILRVSVNFEKLLAAIGSFTEEWYEDIS
jgi:hypothetical protein